ncbi:amidohydrolase family protein [Desulfovibrio sp. OttesenSCG-928-G11]|nr:amidohydrolase family protein [Desulfovibrio sp. OttesenSCG-928-G11]
MNRRTFITNSSLLAAAALILPADGSALAAAAPGAGASRKNTVVDFESHYIDSEIYEYMRKRTEAPYYDEKSSTIASFGDCPEMKFKANVDNLLDVGEGRIKHMDGAGIDIMLISSTVPLEVSFSQEEATKRMTGVNDRLAQTVAKNPSRFKAMASISPHDPKKAAAEIKRCATELGMAGWHMHSHFLGDQYPDHPNYLPLWQAVADLEFPVYLHPTAATFPAMSGYGFAMVGSAFGFAIDATICLVRLIYSGLFEKFPNIKIVTGHMGEAIPYLIQRMDAQLATKGGWSLPKLPGEYLRKNVMFSTSGSFSKEVFSCMKSLVGIDRIVFASDWAYEDLPACTEFIDSLGLSAEEAAMLYSGNAARELRIA